MEGTSMPAAVLAGWRASAAGKDDRSIGSSGPVVSSAGQRAPVRGGLIKSHRRLSQWAGQRQQLQSQKLVIVSSAAGAIG